MRPSLISLCSGSALFGFPIAAGVTADDDRRLHAGLAAPRLRRRRLAAPRRARTDTRPRFCRHHSRRTTRSDLPRAARRHDARRDADPRLRADLEHRRESGRVSRARAPIPNVTVARAVRMAVSLPLFVAPVELARHVTGATVESSTSSRSFPLSISKRAPTPRSPSTASTHPSSSART